MKCFIELPTMPDYPLIDEFVKPAHLSTKFNPTYMSISLKYLKIDIIDIFKNLGLDIAGVIIFRKQPGQTSPLHKDLIWKNNQWQSCNYAVNWNLEKTNSIMEWYQTEEPEFFPSNPIYKNGFVLSGTNYGYGLNLKIDKKKFKIVSTLNLNNPTLVRTDIPHIVRNLDNIDRWCVSVRFQQILSWEEVLQIVQDLK